MLGNYTLIIRNEKGRIIKRVEYNDRYYSGNAMLDEALSWKLYYRSKGEEVSVDW